jgi:hypothetical protein
VIEEEEAGLSLAARLMNRMKIGLSSQTYVVEAPAIVTSLGNLQQLNPTFIPNLPQRNPNFTPSAAAPTAAREQKGVKRAPKASTNTTTGNIDASYSPGNPNLQSPQT